MNKHRVWSFGKAVNPVVVEMRLLERYSLCRFGQARSCSEVRALKFKLSSTRLTRCSNPSRSRRELLERDNTCARVWVGVSPLR